MRDERVVRWEKSTVDDRGRFAGAVTYPGNVPRMMAVGSQMERLLRRRPVDVCC